MKRFNLRQILIIIFISCFSYFIVDNIALSFNLSTPVIPNSINCNKNVHVYLHKASKYQQNGEYEKAIGEFLNVLEVDPQNIIAHFNLGMIYYDQFQMYLNLNNVDDSIDKYLDIAEEEFLRVQEANPYISIVYFKLGRISSIRGNNSLAIDYYKKGIKISPKNFVFYFNIASVYEETGDTDLAIIYYKHCLRLTQSFPHAYNNLALIYEGQGEHKKAIKLYKKALKADSTYVYSLINLGNLLTKEEKFKQAYKYLVMAKKISPNNPYVFLHLGYYFEAQGQYELAYKEYIKFVNLKPNNSKGYYLLCNILNRMNKNSEAMMAGILYLRLDPEGKYQTEVSNIIDEIQKKIFKSSDISEK